jgi:hypothetical protein
MAANQQRLQAEMQQRLLSRERAAPKQLAAADQALQEGDLRLACLIYVRLALARPPTSATEEAKQRVSQLQQQARKELKEVDAILGDDASAARPIPALTRVLPQRELDQRVPKAFQAYDQLASKYAGVPVVGDEISKHIAKQQRRPAYAAVLNEVKAESLWELGQQYEEGGHLCCAYSVYEQAAELVPAPSAQRAQERFAQLKEEPPIVALVEACRELQWCHETYLRAEQLAETKPAPARAMFEQIVRRAPKDSEVYQAALKRMERR